MRPVRRPGAGLLDARAVAVGAGVALTVAVPTIVVSSLLGIGSRSNAVFIPFLIYLGGQVAGGWSAARHRPDAPLSNGAVAALAAYFAIAVVASVIRVVRDRPLDVVSIFFNAFLAASAGILGGLLPSGRRRVDGGSPPPSR